MSMWGMGNVRMGHNLNRYIAPQMYWSHQSSQCDLERLEIFWGGHHDYLAIQKLIQHQGHQNTVEAHQDG